MTEKTKIPVIPDGFQALYNSWHTQYIKENNKWVRRVYNNPFIAIESHIHEDAITDLLAHILQTDEIKMKFINFLLTKANEEKKINKGDAQITEIETQYFLKDKGKKSFIDLLIKIPRKYYIIIENKIFDAEEQQNQMKRYIEAARKEIRKNNGFEAVIAFFATPDGQGICKSAGCYHNNVINLPFYLDDREEETIYSIFSNYNSPSYIQDFCFFLKYKFYNQQSVSFFNNPKVNNDICWEDKKILDGLYKERNYPSISKNINPYDKSEEYFTQLIKVHALNSYLLKKFKNKNYNYHNVFDGFSIRKKATISETDCDVYFETKYEDIYLFMVITICSINKKILTGLLGTAVSKYLYKEDKLNNEKAYSLRLWIQDPSELNKKEDKIKKFNIRGEGYMAYIDFIFVECMKKIFDGIQKKEIDPEALKIYSKYYKLFQQ